MLKIFMIFCFSSLVVLSSHPGKEGVSVLLSGSFVSFFSAWCNPVSFLVVFKRERVV